MTRKIVTVNELMEEILGDSTGPHGTGNCESTGREELLDATMVTTPPLYTVSFHSGLS